jgi:hypothetical protein
MEPCYPAWILTTVRLCNHDEELNPLGSSEQDE